MSQLLVAVRSGASHPLDDAQKFKYSLGGAKEVTME